jgi:hypothetical protein
MELFRTSGDRQRKRVFRYQSGRTVRSAGAKTPNTYSSSLVCTTKLRQILGFCLIHLMT